MAKAIWENKLIKESSPKTHFFVFKNPGLFDPDENCSENTHFTSKEEKTTKATWASSMQAANV